MRVGADALSRANELGEVIKMSSKTHLARLAMATDTLMEEIGQSCNNISIILQKHAKSCQFLMEKPEAALKNFLAGRTLTD